MSRLPDLPIHRTMGDLISDMRKPEPLPDTSWYYSGPSEPHGINSTNSWTNKIGSSGPVSPLSWYSNDDGEVRMRGRITGGTLETLVMKLPEELRPEFTMYFPIESDADGEYVFDGIRFRAFTGEIV